MLPYGFELRQFTITTLLHPTLNPEISKLKGGGGRDKARGARSHPRPQPRNSSEAPEPRTPRSRPLSAPLTAGPPRALPLHSNAPGPCALRSAPGLRPGPPHPGAAGRDAAGPGQPHPARSRSRNRSPVPVPVPPLGPGLTGAAAGGGLSSAPRWAPGRQRQRSAERIEPARQRRRAPSTGDGFGAGGGIKRGEGGEKGALGVPRGRE